MDQAQAITEARRLLGPATAALITDEDVALVIERARTADQATFSGWLLAAELADLLGIRAQGAGTLTEMSSEGTTLKRTAADYFGMAAALRARSGQITKTAGIGVVSIDTGHHGYSAGYPTRYDQGGYFEWDGDVPLWHPWQTPELP